MNSRKEDKYEAEDFALIRIPLRSAEEYQDEENFKLENMLNNPMLVEAIVGASVDLSDAIEKYNETGEAASTLYGAVLNYALRSIIRTTPFGLFCGVTTVMFQEETQITFEPMEQNIIKKCDIDIQWLYKLIKLLECDLDILQNLKIKFNDVCYEVGNKMKNPALNNYGQVDNSNLNTILHCSMINNTRQLQLIKKLTVNFRYFST